MVRIIIRALALVVAFALGATVGPQPAPVGQPATVIIAASAATVTMHTSRLVNCEDHDVQPCWTLDDGALIIVLSYAPYTAHSATVCPSKGAATLPCLARKVNPRTAGDPTTRNYAFGRTI